MSPFASAPATLGIPARVPARCRRRRASRCELPVLRRSTSTASTPPSSRPSRAFTARASAASAPARTRPRAATRVRNIPRPAPSNDRPVSSVSSASTSAATRPNELQVPKTTTWGFTCPAQSAASTPFSAVVSMVRIVRRGCDSVCGEDSGEEPAGSARAADGAVVGMAVVVAVVVAIDSARLPRTIGPGVGCAGTETCGEDPLEPMCEVEEPTRSREPGSAGERLNR